jgi:hypothetical protein
MIVLYKHLLSNHGRPYYNDQGVRIAQVDVTISNYGRPSGCICNLGRYFAADTLGNRVSLYSPGQLSERARVRIKHYLLALMCQLRVRVR